MKDHNEEIVPYVGLFYVFTAWLARRVFSIKGYAVHGAENIPKEGRVVIAPNHDSYLDPPLVGCFLPRLAYIAGKAELFEGRKPLGRLLALCIQHMGTFPVSRGNVSKVSIKRIKTILEGGNALIIFPEGTRSEDGEVADAAPGFGSLIRMNQVDVVPTYLKGTGAALSKRNKRPFPFPYVEVWFGKPIPFSRYDGMDKREIPAAINVDVMEAIRQLKAQADSPTLG